MLPGYAPRPAEHLLLDIDMRTRTTLYEVVDAISSLSLLRIRSAYRAGLRESYYHNLSIAHAQVELAPLRCVLCDMVPRVVCSMYFGSQSTAWATRPVK